jgi:hypothetical protein
MIFFLCKLWFTIQESSWNMVFVFSVHTSPKHFFLILQFLEIMKEHAKTESACGHLPTGLWGHDGAHWGGIPFGIVTKVVGPAGIGKTQVWVKFLSVSVYIITQIISSLSASQHHHDWVVLLLPEMWQKLSFGLLLFCNLLNRIIVLVNFTVSY